MRLPEGLETIGESGFQGAENVRSVTIPSSVREIGTGTFYFGDASRLLSINVDPDNAFYCDVDGVLFTKDRSVLVKYPSARRKASYAVPETVRRMLCSARNRTGRRRGCRAALRTAWPAWRRSRRCAGCRRSTAQRSFSGMTRRTSRSTGMRPSFMSRAC